MKYGIEPRKKDFRPSLAFDVKQLNSSNTRSIASYVTKYVIKNDAKFKCQVWNCSKRDFKLCTTTEFSDQFERLNAVLKEFEIKDHIDRSPTPKNKNDRSYQKYLNSLQKVR